MTKSILLAGVGGQGTILMSKILTEGLVQLGFDVKMCEIHGMAQRGGSVTTQIRYGEKVYSTCIGLGEADVVIAFEKAEGARYLPYLKRGGVLIVNDFEIYSLPVLTGACAYPPDLTEKLIKTVPGVRLIDAHAIAAGLGSPKAQNIVLLGATIKALGLEDVDWKSVLLRFVPERSRELNLRAYEAGLAV